MTDELKKKGLVIAMLAGLRNFGITFVIAALVFGIVALSTVNLVTTTFAEIFTEKDSELEALLANSGTGDKKDNDPDGADETVGESFSLLMILTDYRPSVYNDYTEKTTEGGGYTKARMKKASAIVLTLFDAKNKVCAVVPISPITRVTTPVGEKTLAEIYNIYGSEYLISKVNAITGISADYHAVLDAEKLPSVLRNVGSVTCTVPCEIWTDGKSYYSKPDETAAKIDEENRDKNAENAGDEKKEETVKLEKYLDAGEDSFVGGGAVAMLVYSDYTNGVSDELSASESFAKGLLTRISGYSADQQKSLFNSISGSFVSTNLTTDIVAKNAQTISQFSSFEVKTLAYPGKFMSNTDPEKAYFYPNITTATDMLYSYR